LTDSARNGQRLCANARAKHNAATNGPLRVGRGAATRNPTVTKFCDCFASARNDGAGRQPTHRRRHCEERQRRSNPALIIDLEQRTLQTTDNPFGTRLSAMS
jgi:hypothetical protein